MTGRKMKMKIYKEWKDEMKDKKLKDEKTKDEMKDEQIKDKMKEKKIKVINDRQKDE